MKKFEFPEIDETGMDILNSISFAPKFNKWMYETIKPFCKGSILEIGSGIGNISQHFIKDNYSISITDIRDNYIEILKKNFHESAKDIFSMNIADPNFDSKYEKLFGTFDTVFALNVVEHVKDDVLAIKNIKKLLSTKGKMIILVPAYSWMYNSFDTVLEHYRRYTSKKLRKVMEPHVSIVHDQYFNLFGMAGWFVSGKILKKKTITRSQMELYDSLIIIAKSLDKIVFNKIGLSIICVGEKY